MQCRDDLLILIAGKVRPSRMCGPPELPRKSKSVRQREKKQQTDQGLEIRHAKCKARGY